MRKTLLEELAEAKRNKKYAGRCPVTDPPEKKETREIPVAIRAVVALWHRRRVIAMKNGDGQKRGTLDAAVAYLREAEAEALEYIVCDWLRAHFGLSRRSRITPCSQWRCTVTTV